MLDAVQKFASATRGRNRQAAVDNRAMGGHLWNARQNCAQSKEIPPVYHENSVLAGQEYCLWNHFLKNDPTEVFSRYIGAAALRQQCANIPYGIIGGSRCSCRYFDMAMRHKSPRGHGRQA